MLVDYNYYKEKFYGKDIPQDSFPKYAMDAKIRIDYYTDHRIKEEKITDDIKNAYCEIAELLFKQESLYQNTINENQIISETVGPRSVTYSNQNSLKNEKILTTNELDKTCYKICCKHLIHTGLLYRGVR